MKKLAYLSFLIILTPFLVSLYQGCSDDDNPVNNSATVKGTLTIPAPAQGKLFAVIIDDNIFDPGDGYKYLDSSRCGSGTSVTYSFSNIAAGTYYIYSAVFINGNWSQGPQSGDYIGIYGGTLNNQPNSANATVPSSGTATFNMNLEVMP